MARLRLGIDVDGVLAHFDPAYQRELNRIGGTNIPPYIPTMWHHENPNGFSRETVEEFWNTAAQDPDFWASLLPIAGRNFDTLRKLSTQHDLFYVSKRPLHLQDATRTWLEWQLDGEACALHSNHKGHIAYGLELDAFWDDKPENLMDIGKHSPRTRRFLVDQPWNQIYSPKIRPLPYSVERVKDIQEGFDKLVQKVVY